MSGCDCRRLCCPECNGPRTTAEARAEALALEDELRVLALEHDHEEES